MDSTPTDTGNSIDEPPKRSRLGRVFKWFVILSSVLVIGILATILLLLTYFFPSDMVRQELEVRASEQLQGEVRISSLSFNVLTGLELQQVEFLKQDKSLLKFKRLNLDYSLFGLVNGKLQINEVLVDEAVIDLGKERINEIKLDIIWKSGKFRLFLPLELQQGSSTHLRVAVHCFPYLYSSSWAYQQQ